MRRGQQGFTRRASRHGPARPRRRAWRGAVVKTGAADLKTVQARGGDRRTAEAPRRSTVRLQSRLENAGGGCGGRRARPQTAKHALRERIGGTCTGDRAAWAPSPAGPPRASWTRARRHQLVAARPNRLCVRLGALRCVPGGAGAWGGALGLQAAGTAWLYPPGLGRRLAPNTPPASRHGVPCPGPLEFLRDPVPPLSLSAASAAVKVAAAASLVG